MKGMLGILVVGVMITCTEAQTERAAIESTIRMYHAGADERNLESLACGVHPIGLDVGYAQTSTHHRVAFRPAVAARVSIGDLVIENHPVAIIDGDELAFGVAGITLIQIQGIIGWPVFQNLAVTLDYEHEVATFEHSDGPRAEVANLFWFGYPLVELVSGGGICVHFGLDTGAQKTSLKDRAFVRLSLPSEETGDMRMGVGGSERVQARKTRNLALHRGHARSYANRLS